MAIKPKITIITPTWNRPLEIIERCIRSVKSQTIQEYEHLICSDGFEENVKKYVKSKKDPKIKYLHLKKHYQDYANKARQHAFTKAKADYIIFLDDDNLIFPHYLEKMLNALKNTDEKTAFSICKIIHLGPLPEHLGLPPQIIKGIPVKVQNVDTLQLMIKKKHLKEIGGWNQDQGYLADGYTYEELAKKYDYIEVPEVLGIHF
ncbi:MAG: glycosyltransferase family 2 protein [Candidatus Woesearchaeota archaeon]